jgi:hypothetical protein
MNRIKMIAILLFACLAGICIMGVNHTYAYPPFLKQIKDLGYEAKDCTFCHEKASGGKGWNKRGLWLKDQKKERKAPAVDVRWLKGYNPDADNQSANQDGKPTEENKKNQDHEEKKDEKNLTN